MIETYLVEINKYPEDLVKKAEEVIKLEGEKATNKRILSKLKKLEKIINKNER
mgnify:CR=1 FL=1